MKKTLLSIAAIFAFGAATVLLTSGQNDDGQGTCSSYDPIAKLSGGAAGGYAGDPANGSKNCTNCHAGTNTPIAGLTTSDIPVTGYVPGTTYTITTTRVAPGFNDFGFETAAQSPTGTDLGTFANIDVNETQIKSKTISTIVHKYVTHTATSTFGTDGRSWSYSWTAPATGTGTVTFYSAVLDTDSGGDTPGDATFTSTTVVQENTTIGIAQVATKANINVYPTVSTGKITIEVPNGDYSLEIYSLTGEKVYSRAVNAAVEHVNLNVSNGLYFVNINQGNKKIIKKIVIQ